MKKVYLIGAFIVAIMILILALPQFGAVCSWVLIPTNSSPAIVIFQSSMLGAIVGGLLVFWWKASDPKSNNTEENEDDLDE